MKNLEEIKELLVVVDMVNGFCKKGALADEHIMHIVPELERLIQYYKNMQDAQVAFIRDVHKKGCTEFNKFPEHCLDGTWESEVIDELKTYVDGSLLYKKNSRSTLFAHNFMNDLNRMKELRRVIVAGCCTDLCDTDLAIPMANYFDEMNRNIEIIVPKDAVETYDAPWHNRDEYNKMAFKLMEQEGIKLVKSLGGIR